MSRPERLRNTKIVGATVQAKATTIAAGEARDAAIEELYWAVDLSIMGSYAQMFQALRAVDTEFKLEIIGNLPRIISTFRAGCILQGALLEPMTKAFEQDPNIPNLFCAFPKELSSGMASFRVACARLVAAGEAAPVIQASLAYLVSMTQETLVAGQVTSLQRDVFGRHGFKRLVDGQATEELHHAEWPEMIP